MATEKSVLVVILFMFSVVRLENVGSSGKRLKGSSSSTTTFKPHTFLEENATISPNYMIFGPEFQPPTPKRVKLVKNAVSMDDTNFLPKMMIFEPDKLFWPFVVETDVVPPFGMMSYQPTTKKRRTKSSSFSSNSRNIQLIDRNKTILEIFPNLLEIFGNLQRKGIKISVAETTPEIATIRHLLHLFDLDYMFPHMAIDLDSPVDHVKEIQQDSGLNFTDLIYFGSNKSILNQIKQELKVLTIYVSSNDGLNLMHIYKAIYLYNVRALMSWDHDKLNFTNQEVPDELAVCYSTTQPITKTASRKPRITRMKNPTRNTTSRKKKKVPNTINK